MKIKINGRMTLAELRQSLFQAVNELGEVGISSVKGCNLYLTPLDKEGDEIKPVKNRRELKELVVKSPYRSATEYYDT